MEFGLHQTRPAKFVNLFFLVTSEPRKLWNWSLCGCLHSNTETNLQVYSFVTVYRMNFKIYIFMCHP